MKIISAILILSVSIPSLAAIYNSRKAVKTKKSSFYSTGLELRENNRVGVGLQVAGVSGSAGAQLELNFTQEAGLLAGFGWGSGYQTFHVAYKRMLGGSRFLPYMAVGYTRWFTSNENRTHSQTKPALLGEKFLSEEEKRGSFDEHFLYPGIGIQYVQLSGDYVGTSVYLELDLLFDVDDFVFGPIGSFGMSYYF